MEQQLINGLLTSVGTSGSALIISGEAGIGKSRLLDHAQSEAEQRGFRVLKATGYEAEPFTPFSGLYKLLRPLFGQIPSLHEPQKNALNAALDISGTSVIQPYVVGLATLNLLSNIAASQPLLILIEDAQWLDEPSSDIIAFVARRLENDPMVLLMALRSGIGCTLSRANLQDFPLGGLRPKASESLLDEVAPELAPDTRAYILETAVGNPLALVELPTTLRSDDHGRSELLMGWLPLTEKLEKTFIARVQSLSPPTQTFLLVTALEVNGSLSILFDVSTNILESEVGLSHLDEAISAGLIEIVEDRVRFRHPLMRSAIYQAASITERKTAHACLADALSSEPERRIWHQALSVSGTDEKVAEELVQAAGRAYDRGMLVIALVALEHSAMLSENKVLRGNRLLQAVVVASDLGRTADVVRLLNQAHDLELRPKDKLVLAFIREVHTAGSWSGSAWIRSFVDLAEQMQTSSDYDALDILSYVWLRAFWSNPSSSMQMRVVTLIESLAFAISEPFVLRLLASFAPIQRGAFVLERLNDVDIAKVEPLYNVHILGSAATIVGAFDLAYMWLETVVAQWRTQGILGRLAQVLTEQAWSGTHIGRFASVRRLADEGARLASETGQGPWVISARLAGALALAYQGDTRSAVEAAKDAEKVFLPNGIYPMLALVQFVKGASAIADGMYTDAQNHLFRIFDPNDICYHPVVRFWVYVDLVEAATYSGNQGQVRELQRVLEPLAETTRSPILNVALAFARPLLAEDASAEVLFRHALQFDFRAWPFQRARLLFAFGSWLRRQRRVAESRDPLQTAKETFSALGAKPWVERARIELRAAGVSSQPEGQLPIDLLSPQEQQIAQMVASGMSNREIATQLFLSHRTVSSHLYRIFPKLGITSRQQLANLIHR